MLYRLNRYPHPKQKTLTSIGSDLVIFRRFCDDEDIDYLSAPKKIQRPTWLYRNYLNTMLENNKISPKTLKRKMTTITLFYEWLIDHEKKTFKFPLWNSTDTYIRFKNYHGQEFTKQVATKDVNQIYTNNHRDTYSNEIIDGGKLYPLPHAQQKILFKSLKEIGNIEMLLGFLIAVSTGARIQTVFTLRIKQFTRETKPDEQEIKISVGPGTGVDTKYSKSFLIYVPRFLYLMIQVYIRSERAKNRREKTKCTTGDQSFQYLFLTNRGSPYYVSMHDSCRRNFSIPPDGATIRAFIAGNLSKKIQLLDPSFRFNFHNLRATYGINYINSRKNLIQEGLLSEMGLEIDLQMRMAHSSLETTRHYTKYEKRNKEVRKAQNEHELFLKSLLDDEILF